MKQISRKEAETIFQKLNVISSCIEQDTSEMRIFMTLSDNRAFVMKYAKSGHAKQYFLQDAPVML